MADPMAAAVEERRWWELGQKLGKIEEHVKATNGNIADARNELRDMRNEVRQAREADQGRLSEVEKKIASREDSCPMVTALRGDIEKTRLELAVKSAEGRASAAVSKTWWTNLKPAIWAIIGALTMLLIGHGNDLLKAFFGGAGK